MQINQPHGEEHDKSFLQSATAKIVMIGALALVLLIPLQLVKNLISERAERQDEVVNEIQEKWGGSVYFSGPILKVPYNTYTVGSITDSKTGKAALQRIPTQHYAYFLPDELNSAITVDTEKKNRNNYESVVFLSKNKLTGHYSTPNFSSRKIAADDIAWDKATFIVKTNNIKSIKGSVAIATGGRSIAFEPTAAEERDTVATLETAPLDARSLFASGKSSFKMEVNYAGSGELQMVPIGKVTSVTMASNWAAPSFDGNFLPEQKQITANGFNASWKISSLNRAFPQRFFGALPKLSEFAFAVKFVIPIDEYQQNERAAKYGFLVIGLTFLVFFLIQAVNKINIHIFQYGMIGLALVMFYTLLISITEHSSFRLAYLIAGIAVVAMIGLYSLSILRNGRFTAFITAALSALYGFIYIIIQLENYALLAGSIGLFLILGAVMYFSRKIDWSLSQV